MVASVLFTNSGIKTVIIEMFENSHMLPTGQKYKITTLSRSSWNYVSNYLNSLRFASSSNGFMSNIIRFFFIISNSMFVTEPISGAVLMLWGIWGLVLVLGALLLLSYCYGANNPKLNNNPFFIITISFFQLLLQIVSVKLEKLEVSKTKACQSTSKCAIFQKNWNSVAIWEDLTRKRETHLNKSRFLCTKVCKVFEFLFT